MTRILTVAIALAAIAGNADVASAQAKKYATPREVYDAAKAAAAKKDYKAISECFTAETVDGMCGGMIFVGSLVKAFAKFDKAGKGADAAKQIDKIFEKYGLSKDKIEASPKVDFGKDPEGANRALQALGKLVKDQPGFFGDMSNLLDSQGKKKDSLFDAMSNLAKDPEIDEKNKNTAKGTVIRDKTERAINFKKIDGGWRIDLPIEFGTKKASGTTSDQSEPRRLDEALALVRFRLAFSGR
ncbi:MAG: hypothetical protein FJ303_23945 [Planctomycetes bacterium]|nr:hypothetical protein [Planctomycetota bacterium]